ncbi:MULTISPECIES: hypothetical protein [unclassified Pseudomonas]|uniref:hypothetical protein n=1 Tax=unclassified Pseudomonas TaxID=196821 RepID=UPI00128C3645|nr:MULTISPECIES: hypothetical protein [unclassified Pseudomonas]MPQ69670.1 hypothetical protein [Pseudomonas sp. MWU12-2323]
MSVRSTATPFHHKHPAPLAGSGRDSIEQRRVFQMSATGAMVQSLQVETMSLQNMTVAVGGPWEAGWMPNAYTQAVVGHERAANFSANTPILLRQQPMKFLDRVADPHEDVEFYLQDRGLVLSIVILLVPIYFIFYPSNWIIFFHWPWVSAFLAVATLFSILHNAKWSPIYAGPILVVNAEGISGRGGFLYSGWTVSWDQIGKFDWGRCGLVIYKKHMQNWDIPLHQGGVGGPQLVRALNTRLSAYALDKSDPQEDRVKG